MDSISIVTDPTPVLAVGTLALAAVIAWQRRIIARMEQERIELEAAALFAHGIREISAANYASCWDAECDEIEVTRHG